jgi:hypothetical protein
MAPENTSVAAPTIRFSDDLQGRQDRGELIALATFFFDPKSEHLTVFFPDTLTEEEAVAVLKKYRCWPR